MTDILDWFNDQSPLSRALGLKSPPGDPMPRSAAPFPQALTSSTAWSGSPVPAGNAQPGLMPGLSGFGVAPSTARFNFGPFAFDKNPNNNPSWINTVTGSAIPLWANAS
jgi:hypothetical protein